MKKLTVILLSAGALILSVAGSVFAGPGNPDTVVPEPGTFVLLGLGAAGLVAYKKFKK